MKLESLRTGQTLDLRGDELESLQARLDEDRVMYGIDFGPDGLGLEGVVVKVEGSRFISERNIIRRRREKAVIERRRFFAERRNRGRLQRLRSLKMRRNLAGS